MASRFLDGVHADDVRYEPTPRRVRAELASTTVVDSTRALLVWEPGRAVPVYAFPDPDVRTDALPPDAARRLDDPDLRDYLVLAWPAMDRWLEEDEEVLGHPRDPFHRVDARQASRHVRVELDGVLLAESRRPVLVFETGLPVRHYLPRDDVRLELLEPTETVTVCAYKGRATYWSVRGAGDAGRDLVWSYPDPLPDARPLAGLIAFLGERSDVTVDGERQERPRTPWSDGVRHGPRGGGSA